ncbi:MAG: hypothetical protein IPP74_06540 [Alphaproteobacteria bacterium]|nr:hypothetical protein [Alphaproteobacteria bacterium]
MIRLLNSIPRWFKQKSDYSEISSEPDFPQGFGYKTAWLAIPSKSLDEIIKVLHLSQPVKANWQSGLNHIYNDRKDNHVFVTPLIKGWNFVIGFGIGSFSTDKENNKIFLHSLTSLAQKMPNFIISVRIVYVNITHG